MALILVPTGARAVLGLDRLEISVATQGAGFEVTFTVIGTEIASATLAPEGASTALVICSDAPASCSVTQSVDQNALDTLLPTTARNYTLELTGTTGTPAPTLSDTFSFGRPATPPSPAISAPGDAASVDPGPLQVSFTACGTACTSTRGTLSSGGEQLEERLDLGPSASSWTPATALEPRTDYSVQITHAIERTENLTADTPADPYVLAASVSHADSVAFSSGSAAPAGDFCIVVNDDEAGTLAMGCAPGAALVSIESPAAGIVDTSGAYAPEASAAGIVFDYTQQLAPNGRLSGIARADLDGDAVPESPTELRGRLGGREGALKQRIRARFVADATKLLVRLHETANLATLLGTDELEWLVEQKARGRDGGMRLKETTTSTRSEAARTGWKLEFTLTGTDGRIVGALELASGAGAALAGQHVFDSGSNRSDLELRSEGAERGARIRVHQLEIGDTTGEIASGTLRFRAFGQRGSVLLQ